MGLRDDFRAGVAGGPSHSYTELMNHDAPSHRTRTDSGTGCRWEPQDEIYSHQDSVFDGDRRPTSTRSKDEGLKEAPEEWEEPHPGTKRGDSCINEEYEEMIRHAQAKTVRVLGLEDERLRGEDGTASPPTSSESPSTSTDREPHGIEKMMTKIREKIDSPSPSPSSGGIGEEREGEEHGFGRVMTKIREGFEHTLMGRQSAGCFDPRFWERREELDSIRRTTRRDGKEMREMKREGEG